MLDNIKNHHWALDHIGHAVFDLDTALQFYLEVLQFNLLEQETLLDHQVKVAFVEKNNTVIELLCPLASNKLLKKFLDSRGEALHHLCFRVNSVNEELNRLKAKGVRLIDQQARPGSRNTEIAFLHPSSTHGLLIELCHALAS